MVDFNVENSEMQDETEPHQVIDEVRDVPIETSELENMSDGDLSNLEKAPIKVENYLQHDYIAAKEHFAKYNEVMVRQTVIMLDKLFTAVELKEIVLQNLK